MPVGLALQTERTRIRWQSMVKQDGRAGADRIPRYMNVFRLRIKLQ